MYILNPIFLIFLESTEVKLKTKTTKKDGDDGKKRIEALKREHNKALMKVLEEE